MPEDYQDAEEMLLIWVVMGVVAFWPWAWALVVVAQLAVMVVVQLALLLELERVGFG